MAGDTWLTGLMAQLRDLEQHDIAVTIRANFMHGLHVTRLFTLEPQFIAGATEIHSAAQLGGFLQCLAVHPRKHQHVAAGLLLRNNGDEAFVVPLDLFYPIHCVIVEDFAPGKTTRIGPAPC